jgi:hypothetical protein
MKSNEFLEKTTGWLNAVIGKYFPNLAPFQYLWIWWVDGIILGIFLGWLLF